MVNKHQPSTSLGRLLVAALAGLVVGLAGAHAEEDDSDQRADVRVKTKRDSLGAHALGRLVELTEEHSPTIKTAKFALDGAGLDQLNARVTFLPSLDVTASHGLYDQFGLSKGNVNPYASQLDLVLSEKLYDNGQSLIDLDVKSTRLRRARLEYEFTRDGLLRDMALAFLVWSSAQQMREIDENKRDLLRRQFNVLDAQYKQGLKTKRDVLRIETEMRRLEMSILERDNEVDLDFQQLAGLVGVTLDSLADEDIEGEEPRPYVGQEPNLVEIKAPDHRQAKILGYQAKEKELGVRSAQRNFWPNVNINGSTGYHNLNYLGTGFGWNAADYFDFGASLVLSYNLLDFGTRRRQIEQARLNVKTQVASNEVTLNALANDLRDNWNKLHQYRDQVKMSRELLSLEQQSYSILEAEYRNGRASYLDLITNLNSLIDARSRYITSYFGLRQAQIKYAFHKGDLYENLK